MIPEFHNSFGQRSFLSSRQSQAQLSPRVKESVGAEHGHSSWRQPSPSVALNWIHSPNL